MEAMDEWLDQDGCCDRTLRSDQAAIGNTRVEHVVGLTRNDAKGWSPVHSLRLLMSMLLGRGEIGMRGVNNLVVEVPLVLSLVHAVGISEHRPYFKNQQEWCRKRTAKGIEGLYLG